MSAPKHSSALLRELAVASQTDPRTVAKVLRGEQVRGMAGDRVRKVARARGLLPVEPKP